MWLYPLPALLAFCGFVFIIFNRPNYQKAVKYALALIIIGLIIYLIRSYKRGEFPFQKSEVAQ